MLEAIQCAKIRCFVGEAEDIEAGALREFVASETSKATIFVTLWFFRFFLHRVARFFPSREVFTREIPTGDALLIWVAELAHAPWYHPSAQR